MPTLATCAADLTVHLPACIARSCTCRKASTPCDTKKAAPFRSPHPRLHALSARFFCSLMNFTEIQQQYLMKGIDPGVLRSGRSAAAAAALNAPSGRRLAQVLPTE